MYDEILKGFLIGVCVMGLFFIVCFEVGSVNNDEMIFPFFGQRFVRVDAEHSPVVEAEWCEVWVCNETVPVIGEMVAPCVGGCVWIVVDSQRVTTIDGVDYVVDDKCVSERLVRRRC